MLDFLTSASLLRLVGALIVMLALVHVIMASSRAWLDLRSARLAHALRLRQLMDHIESETLQRRIEQSRAVGGWSGTRKFRVARKVAEAAGVYSFYLVPHDGKPLPLYHAGQYLTLRLRLPGRDKPLVRCYSLSDAPQDSGCYRISVKRLAPPPDQPDAAPGQSSSYLHAAVNEGDILDVKAPAGSFTLEYSDPRPLVMIAGGIGLTPVFSMLKALLVSGSRRELWLFYGVRNSDEHCFARELAQLAATYGHFHLHVCYDQPLPGDQPGRDYQHAGQIDVGLLRRCLPSNNFSFYVCGPPPMMASLCAGLAAWQVPATDVRTEAFGSASVKKVERPLNGASRGGALAATPAFAITFARSRRTVAWDDADNLLEFAEAHGIAFDFGCRAGGCGTCMTAVREGDVEYIRDPDAQPEAGSCLACISRPKSDLVLDA